MRRIIIITGLPGSGKTMLGKHIAHHLRGVLVDDPNSLDQLPEHFNVLIIADPFLVYKKDQDRAEAYLYDKYPDCNWIEWIFFENDPEQCLKNAINRQKSTGEQRGVRAFINFASKCYNIRPDAVLVKPVYKPTEEI